MKRSGIPPNTSIGNNSLPPPPPPLFPPSPPLAENPAYTPQTLINTGLHCLKFETQFTVKILKLG